MSGLSGRKIKFIALALGVICAIMFAALAYAGFAGESAVNGICWYRSSRYTRDIS